MPDSSTRNNDLLYRGRFAPSPTGPLHAGSVMAALASYLDAKSNAGRWYVRIEDLDPPREIPRATDQILRTLDRLGLHWDGEIVFQSQRFADYEMILDSLASQSLAYYCTCSRGILAGGSDSAYPGYCRDRHLPRQAGAAIRCKVDNHPVTFTDRMQGSCTQQLETCIGDFVIKRKDGLHAYQLAVVVDDGWQQITHVVRGIDLLDSTPRQIHLQGLLGLPTPSYAHIPVLINQHQQKISKQNLAQAVDASAPAKVLFQALTYLQQQPDPSLVRADRNTVMEWGIAHWNPARLAGIGQVPEIAASSPAAV